MERKETQVKERKGKRRKEKKRKERKGKEWKANERKAKKKKKREGRHLQFFNLCRCCLFIFIRVPGDMDAVTVLRQKVENWEVDLPESQVTSPHVPSSLLKLWYR